MAINLKKKKFLSGLSKMTQYSTSQTIIYIWYQGCTSFPRKAVKRTQEDRKTILLQFVLDEHRICNQKYIIFIILSIAVDRMSAANRFQ